MVVVQDEYEMVREGAEGKRLQSSDSHATGRSQPATHSLTSVVLPKPAGAEMRVTLGVRCSPAFNRSIRCWRRTTLGRGGGMKSLVAKMVAGTDQL